MITSGLKSKLYSFGSCLTSVQKRGYNQKQKIESFTFMTKLLIDHLERPIVDRFQKPVTEITKDQLKNITEKFTLPLVNKILFQACQSDSVDNEDQEVESTLKKSICQTMKEIMERVPGSKKGIMYPEKYYEEVLGGKTGYLEYILQKAKNLENEHLPCFEYGEDAGHFIMKKGFTASEALHSFLEGPTAADCGSTVEVVYLKAIFDLLGNKKFDSLFKNKLQIRKWVCHDSRSSLYPFIEFVNPIVYTETNPNKLKVGDHLCITGVPWYSIKHPFGHMKNMHGVVIGYNEEKDPLVGGLELSSAKTISQIMQELVDDCNVPQTLPEIELIQLFSEDSYLNPIRISEEMSKFPHLMNIDKTHIFRDYNVQEIKSFGGCKIYNEHTCRLSTLVLKTIKESHENENLQDLVQSSKAFSLARQMIQINKGE